MLERTETGYEHRLRAIWVQHSSTQKPVPWSGRQCMGSEHTHPKRARDASAHRDRCSWKETSVGLSSAWPQRQHFSPRLELCRTRKGKTLEGNTSCLSLFNSVNFLMISLLFELITFKFFP